MKTAAQERAKEKRVHAERESTSALTRTELKFYQALARDRHDEGWGYKRIARDLNIKPRIVGRWIRGGQPRPRRG